MRKDAYHLIDHCQNIPFRDAMELRSAAQDVHDSIIEGISAIGSIMFAAGNSEDYDDGRAKIDMMKLGDMLTNISRLAAGAKTAEENISYAIRKGVTQ